MGFTKFLLKKAKHFNTERFNKHIEEIHKNTGKSKLYIKLDFIKNFLQYGCGYTDYFRGDYINLTSAQKKTFVNTKTYYKILEYLNDDKYTSILSDKAIFANYFKEYLKREFIDLRTASLEDFTKFMSGKTAVVSKELNNFGGHGVSKINVSDFKSIEEMYNSIKSKKQYLVEQLINQADDVNELNPNAVASFRVITLYKDGKVILVDNSMRINQGDINIVGSADDIYFRMNEDGTINGNAIDDYAHAYVEHPLTHKKFSEVKIHNVKEAFEMCKTAALKLPNVRYIGWDVGLSKDGPVLIEGNEYPGYGVIQHFGLCGSKVGHKKQLEELLGDEFKNIKL